MFQKDSGELPFDQKTEKLEARKEGNKAGLRLMSWQELWVCL